MSVHQVDNVSDGQGSLPGVPGVIRQLLPGLGEMHAFGVPGVIRQLLPGLGETQHVGLSPLLWAAEAGARGEEHLPCSVSTRFPSVPP